MEKGACKCHISYYPKPDHIIYCPKHKAAFQIYDALKNLIDRRLVAKEDGDHYDEIIEALAKAEGR